MVIVGTDSHAFVGDAFDCEGVLGTSTGRTCGAGRMAAIHNDRPEPAPMSEKWAATPQPEALSTSAQLRQVQAALAASQADLTRVEQERDEARAELASVRLRRPYVATLERALSDADAAHDRTRAELARARIELEQLRALLPNSDENRG